MTTDDSQSTLTGPNRREFGRLLISGLTALAGGSLIGQLSCRAPKLGEREMTLKPLKGVLKEALKNRIFNDDPTNFKDSGWEGVRLGIYYDEDDELVNIVVYETTAFVAQAQTTGTYLTDQVWRNLIAKVGPNNTAEEALDPMVEAVMLGVPLPPGNEGPVINRPPKRVTLRSQRKPVKS